MGTHDYVYYKSEEFPFTRFTDDYVSSNHKVVRACGKRGGGFIFDTHTIHRGVISGVEERLAVILEFHPKGKCNGVAAGLGLPCPSGDQRILHH